MNKYTFFSSENCQLFIIRLLFNLFLFTLIPINVNAIKDCIPISDTTKRADSVFIDPVYRRFKTSINYSSANTMLGKRDSIPIPILSPTFKYTSSKDFFYQLSLVHSNTTNKVFDEIDLKVGKNFYLGDRWNFTIAYSRFIFSKEVDRLNAVINNDFNVYSGYDWGHDLYTGVSLDYTTGNKTKRYIDIDSTWKPLLKKYLVEVDSGYTSVSAKDFTVTLMNSMTFYFYNLLNNNDRLIFTPEIDITWGTQNGVESNASAKKLLIGKKKFSKSTSETFKTNTYFLAYTFNLDFSYKINRWGINISPYYTIPQNITSGAASSPYFVMYGGVNYTLKWETNKNK